MRTLATAIILLFGVALIVIHHRYTSAISRAMEEESSPVPIQIGPIDSSQASSLRFQIQNIQKNQRVETENRKGSIATSDWTVFDCVPDSDPSATFRLALSPTPPVTGQSPASGADAILWVTERDAGDRLVTLLSDVLDVNAPSRRKPSAALQSMKIGVAVLGQHLPAGESRQLTADESHVRTAQARGKWTATRWSIEDDGLEAEVWCNYNLADGRGEIVKKNPDDGRDLVQAMAVALRDGPRPPRTPEDDPTLVATGPHVRDLRHVESGPASSFFFTPTGSILLMSMDSGVSVSLLMRSQPDSPKQLVRFEGMLAGLVCADETDDVFIMQESGAVTQDGMPWWQAPQHIWRVDRKNNKKDLIDGPWGDAGAMSGPLALSPDRRHLIVSHRRYTQDGQRVRATYIHDLKTGQTQKANYDSSSEVVSWVGGSDDPKGGPVRAIVAAGNGYRFNPDYQRQYYSLDPTNGHAEPIDEVPAPDPQLSPDKKLRFDFEPGVKVDVIDVQSNKRVGTFDFHPDDQRYAREGTIQWLTSKYLVFRGKRQATIDISTMKMCYITPPAERRMFLFDRDMQWAAGTDEKGLYVGEIAVDAERPTTAPITGVDPDDDSIQN